MAKEDFWEGRGDGTWRGDSLDALGVFVKEDGKPKGLLIVILAAILLVVGGLFLSNLLTNGDDKPAATPTATPTETPTPTATPEPTEPPIPEVGGLIRGSFAADWSSTSIPGCSSAWTAPSAGWSSLLVEGRVRDSLIAAKFTANTNWSDAGFKITGTGSQNGVSSVTVDYSSSDIQLCLS